MKKPRKHWVLPAILAVVFLYIFLRVSANTLQKTVALINLNFEKFRELGFARFDHVLLPGFIVMCFLIYDYIVAIIFDTQSFYTMVILRDNRWLSRFNLKIMLANAQMFLLVFGLQCLVMVVVFGIDISALGLLSLYFLKLCLVFDCVSSITLFLAIGNGSFNMYAPFFLIILGLSFDITLNTHFVTISDSVFGEAALSVGYGLCALIIYQLGIRHLTRKGEL